MTYRRLFATAFFVLLASIYIHCKGSSIPETLLLDEWWMLQDLSSETEAIEELQNGLCFIFVSDGDMFTYTVDDTLGGPYAWDRQGDGTFNIDGIGSMNIELVVGPPDTLWQLTFKRFLVSIDSDAVLCDRLPDDILI